LDVLTVELREAAPDDADALAPVAAGGAEVDARYAYEGSSTRARDAAVTVMKGNSDILVAYAGDRAVGVAALRTFGTGIGEIKRMYVVPEQRGNVSREFP
jgi:hypothetical protein